VTKPIGLFLVLGTASFIAGLILLDEAEGLRNEARSRSPSRDEAACVNAAEQATRNLAWLADSHPQRAQGLLLLARDAAWAPVCAASRADGAALQHRILVIVATPMAPGAIEAAGDLAGLLERGR
jgi:hypothetical protein